MDYLGTCVLKTSGYEVTFRFRPIRTHGYISAQCTMEIFQEDEENLKFGFPAFFSLVDFPRLTIYFENHIAGLKTNPQGDELLHAAINGNLNYKEALVFTDVELNFTLQALFGEIGPNDEGTFRLRFMVKGRSGRSAEGHITWVKIGAECSVSVTQIREFTASVRELTVKNREHFLQSLTEDQLWLRKVAEFYGGQIL